MLFILDLLLILSCSIFIVFLFSTEKVINIILGVYLIFYSIIVLTSEVASLFYLLNNILFHVLFHFGLCLLFAWLYRRYGKSSIQDTFSFILIRNFLAKTWKLLKDQPALLVLALGVFIAYLLNAVIILTVPPNNYDSMTTHMVRVGYWLQFGSFLHWASQNILQIIYPINAQSQILWTVLMTGSDHLAGFVQFMGIPIGGISIIGICRLLNYSRPQSVFAGLLWMTLPEIILQSTTTQNDLVVSGLIIACVYFLYDGLISGNSEAFVLSSLALGLALGTKQTTFFILPGLGLICLIIFLTNKQFVAKNMVLWGITSMISFLLVGSFIYLANFIQ